MEKKIKIVTASNLSIWQNIKRPEIGGYVNEESKGTAIWEKVYFPQSYKTSEKKV